MFLERAIQISVHWKNTMFWEKTEAFNLGFLIQVLFHNGNQQSRTNDKRHSCNHQGKWSWFRLLPWMGQNHCSEPRLVNSFLAMHIVWQWQEKHGAFRHSTGLNRLCYTQNASSCCSSENSLALSVWPRLIFLQLLRGLLTITRRLPKAHSSADAVSAF